MTLAFGIDIGGSGVKAAPVELDTGLLAAPRQRVPTPQPATPSAIVDICVQLVRAFEWTEAVGATVPAVVQRGVVRSAANIDKSWIDVDAAQLFGERLGQPVVILNDADAAGVAELVYGAARDEKGVVLVVTLGTGIGTALFADGVLVPNTELGHLEVRGKEAEKRAADVVRTTKGLSWEKWAGRVDEYLGVLNRLFSPDKFVIGGGVSRKADKWMHFLTTPVVTVPAGLRNEAGIVGAALATRGVEIGSGPEHPAATPPPDAT